MGRGRRNRRIVRSNMAAGYSDAPAAEPKTAFEDTELHKRTKELEEQVESLKAQNYELKEENKKMKNKEKSSKKD